ncbi:hypothetical protein PT316_02280, partial [Metamycoplasma hyosynoviae]
LLSLVIIFILYEASYLARTISLFAISSILPETMSTWIYNFTPYNDFLRPENNHSYNKLYTFQVL